MIPWVPYYIVPELYMRALGPDLDRLEDMREKMMWSIITFDPLTAGPYYNKTMFQASQLTSLDCK